MVELKNDVRTIEEIRIAMRLHKRSANSSDYCKGYFESLRWILGSKDPLLKE